MTKQTDTKQSHRLKFALVTETFKPEINGVAMTLGKVTEYLSNNQHQVQVIRPKQSNLDAPADTQNFKEVLVTGMPIPFYKHLKFGFPAKNRLIKFEISLRMVIKELEELEKDYTTERSE